MDYPSSYVGPQFNMMFLRFSKWYLNKTLLKELIKKKSEKILKFVIGLIPAWGPTNETPSLAIFPVGSDLLR